MTSKDIMGICRTCRQEFTDGAAIYLHEMETGHRVRAATATTRGTMRI